MSIGDIPKNVVETPSAPSPAGEETNGHASPPSHFTLGLDVAKYQSGMRTVEWDMAKKEGYSFVIPKATDGAEGIDPMYKQHTALAKSRGFVVGAGYCFNRFFADPIAQAKHLMTVTGGTQKGELPLCLDVEWDNSASGKALYGDGRDICGGHPGNDDGANHVLACLNEIERLDGVTPWIYTAYYFFKGVPHPERFARFPLWLNDFHAKTFGDLRIPPPWKAPVMWQYSGKISIGNVKEIDGNRVAGGMNELLALTRK